jgi:hypothetical protein
MLGNNPDPAQWARITAHQNHSRLIFENAYLKSVIYRCHVKVKDGKLPTSYQPGKKAHYLHDRYYLGRRPHDLRAVEDRLGHDREGG